MKFVYLFSVCRGTAVDIVFVLDSSGSIRDADPPGGNNWNLMLQFVINIIRRLDIGQNNVHVGLVTFAESSRIDFLLDTYYDKNDLIAAVKVVPYMSGGTHTSAGLLDMRINVFDPGNSDIRGDRASVPDIAVVITDGESNIEPALTIPYAVDATSDGIFVLAVGITDKVDEAELKGISSTGIEGQTYWKSPDFQVADVIVQNIVNATCHNAGGGRFHMNVLVLQCYIFIEPTII